jgi:hypothetical protein
MLFLVKNSLVKKEVWNSVLSWCNSQFFVTKVLGEVFSHFHAVTVKRYSRMQNWLFGMPGRILWCQRGWVCSWLCRLPVSPFSVSVSLDMPFKHPCTAHACIPKLLPNHCQGLCHTFSEICTKFDVHTRCGIHRGIASWLQVKGHKKSACPPSCMKSYTLTPKIC